MTQQLTTNLHTGTPGVQVLGNRGLTVRELALYRATAQAAADIRLTRHRYDARGFLFTSTDPRLYEYQQQDNTVAPNSAYLTTLSGQVLRTDSADAGRAIMLNDIEGRPVMAVKAAGVVQRWTYEGASLPGRLLSVSEQLPDAAVARVKTRRVWAGDTPAEKACNLAGRCAQQYDTAGLQQTDSVSLTGAVLSARCRRLRDDAEADWSEENDEVRQERLDTPVFITRSATDATGALLMQTDARGNRQRLTYNVAGQLAESKLRLNDRVDEQVIVASMTYSAAGRKLREAQGNGIVTTYTYAPENQRLIGVRTERPANHALGARVLQDLRYEYDPVGNVVRLNNDAQATRYWRNQKVVSENTYTYDSLYQLIATTGREMAGIIGQQSARLPASITPGDGAYTNYTRHYTYDRGGNLTHIRHSAPATGNNYTTTMTVSNRANRAVLSTLAENPTQVDRLFTADGLQTQLLPGQHLGWTARGELRQVTPISRDEGVPADREWYRYGGDSQRVLKVSEQWHGNNRQVHRVNYLPGLELRTVCYGDISKEALSVICVGEAGRAQVRVLHWEIGQPGIPNNQLRYSYSNLIGSSGLEVDGDGNIISQEEYYPYGGTAVWTARNQTEAAYKTVRYSGKERDATGLYYYGYRYYQPWAGRWLSADPAGTVDGLNLYRMVRNNPVTLSDTDGLAPTTYAELTQIEEFKRLDELMAFPTGVPERNFVYGARWADEKHRLLSMRWTLDSKDFEAGPSEWASENELMGPQFRDDYHRSNYFLLLPGDDPISLNKSEKNAIDAVKFMGGAIGKENAKHLTEVAHQALFFDISFLFLRYQKEDIWIKDAKGKSRYEMGRNENNAITLKSSSSFSLGSETNRVIDEVSITASRTNEFMVKSRDPDAAGPGKVGYLKGIENGISIKVQLKYAETLHIPTAEPSASLRYSFLR